MYLIDVHMIIYDESNCQVDRCLQSLKDEPINLHFVEGRKEWPPFEGRARGFAMGSAPYVSYVDPDDTLVPGAFEKLLAAISAGDYVAAFGYEAAMAGEVFLQENTSPHHAFLLKRGLPIDYAGGFRVFGQLSKDRVVCVPEVFYHWRRDY